MIEDGLFERFGIEEVFGMHNDPGLAIGAFSIRAGPLMAAADSVRITIEGTGSHAARPHTGVDPVVVASHVVTALQSVVARNVDPIDSAVVSITMIEAGTAENVIPQAVTLRGTLRSLSPEVREMLVERVRAVTESVAVAFGARATVSFRRGYPVTVNDAGRTAFATAVATEIAGAQAVDPAVRPMMGAEDFSYMLEKRPGAMIFLGNGDSAELHNPSYDFSDAAIPFGASYWVRLAETALAG
jgi:hippurate hydrolase